mgnify:CR=1 FL=1
MIDYIVVQAGGKGTRLEYLTKNKPKALVPVENLPMLFHLFHKYPNKKFVIIADYKKEVLHEYLSCFAKVKYQVVDAEGTGTCAGVKQALALLPKHTPFMLVWSDLILPETLHLPEVKRDYIGISQTFPCRWSYREGRLSEERSADHGVAGFFLFTEKEKLADVPQSGELVRWMQERSFEFEEIGLAGTREFGVLEEYRKLEQEKCRPFNRLTFADDMVIKEGIDEQGRKLAVRECAWYKAAREVKIEILPQIYGIDPLRMERIQGENIYECRLDHAQKKEILGKLVSALRKLHSAVETEADSFSLKEAYFNKTMQRLSVIRDLVPFADRRTVNINGKTCRNVFFYKRELEKALESLECEKFALIHGDCTFSNMMLREDGTPVLIDPRGYFGFTELYGDPMYDWAKLYYSLAGNYDRFNLKDFRLVIEEEKVELNIVSSQWEDMEEEFFRLTGADKRTIKLLHAIIWLSLTTYAWQDYDSVCGAFYNGLYYLEDVL